LRFHFSATKDEYANLVSAIGIEGSRPITDSVILGQDNPTLSSNFRYPVFVWGVLGKMGVVDLHLNAALAKFFCDYLLAQRAVNEED